MKNAVSTISVICFVISGFACFTVTPSQNDIRSLSTTSLLLSSVEGFSENNVEDNDEHVTDDEDATSAAETVISPASVTMDDGGSCCIVELWRFYSLTFAPCLLHNPPI
jgi:hypothetical protein